MRRLALALAVGLSLTAAGPAFAAPAADGTSNTIQFGELRSHLMEPEGIFFLVGPPPPIR
jgi:hypothetical protein